MKRLALSILLLLGLVGCASRSDRGNLSDAMRSGSGHGGGGHSHDSYHSDSDYDSVGDALVGGLVEGMFAAMFSDNDDDSGASSDYQGERSDWLVPLEASYVKPLNGEIDSLARFTLSPFSIEEGHHFFGLYLGGGVVNFKDNSLPHQSLDDAWMMEFGMNYRFYLTESHTFLSPYLSASAGWQPMFWHYRDPVFTDDDTVSNDCLNGLTGYVGFGVGVWRNQFLSVFTEAGFGGTVFVGSTVQGFHNDVLHDYGYFTVKTGITFRF